MKPIQFDRVADLYDYYVDVDFDLPYFINEAKNAGGKVLELTSGTGRVSLPLLREGIDLTCVDHSKAMLDVLRRKAENENLPCKLVAMDMTELSLRDRFRLIFIPFNSFSEILDRGAHERVLLLIRDHLEDGGEFICTLHNATVRLRNIDGRPGTLGRFPAADGGSLVVRYHFNHDAASQLVHGFQYYELYDEIGQMTGERSLEINFYLFTREEFELLARYCGFEIVGLYGDYSLGEFDQDKSPFMIWKLRKTDNGSDYRQNEG